MGFFQNLRLRRRLGVAMIPLVLMVLAAGIYSSLESNLIDKWYSALIDTQVRALRSAEEARAHTNRFGLFLFELVSETSPDRKQVLDGDLEQIRNDYHAAMAKVLEASPDRAAEINAASALFDRADADARPVRASALAGDNAKALNLLRGNVNQELQNARQANIGIIAELQTYIDQRSEQLTQNTHHAILITWLVIGFGLLASWAAAFYTVESKVVKELRGLQTGIQNSADGRLDEPIPYLDRRNEIGEIARALQTLQIGARERRTQAWVKTEVAATVAALQPAQDYPGFGKALLSRLSQSVPLIYGAFYISDDSHKHFSRAYAYANTDASRKPW